MYKDKLKILPEKPGCYLMKNKDSVIIYVGKAKNIKKRVNSYFNKEHTGKTKKLVEEIHDIEYVIVGSETEALILELNLIKKHSPKYNVLMRDDKSYPYIELTEEKFPRLVVVRNINKKKKRTSYLFGPYPNVTAARETVNLLNRIYPIRKCRILPNKPCLYYHIEQCLGFCFKDIEDSKTDEMIKEILLFLRGDHSLITKKIEEEMKASSDSLNYEKALELKNMLDYIKETLAKQKVETADSIDRDIFASYVIDDYISIQVFFIRNGKIVERHSKIGELIDSEEEVLTRYIADFYDKDIIMPKEIIVSNKVNEGILSEYLKAKVIVPKIGNKKKLLDMAAFNSKAVLEEKIELIKRQNNRTEEVQNELKELLGLNKLYRIDIFDNSNIAGSYNVGGMVVFKDGIPSKNDYRKYKVLKDVNDDYGTFKEVLYRRYFRMLKDNEERPDLIIIDGGIGQYNVAKEIIESLNLNIPHISLKKDDNHNTDKIIYKGSEIDLKKNSQLYFYLARMQDEVHNFTISFHKQIRSKGSLSSVLDDIEGIGEARKTKLLKKYKNLNNIKLAKKEELLEILPEKVIENLLKKI